MNLENADLSDFDLSRIDFTHAYLKYVDFTDADLTTALLREAFLHGAIFGNTQFNLTNLTDAIDLENASHSTYSFLDLGTVSQSLGRIPEAFLKGACHPNDFSEFLKFRDSLLAESAQPDPDRTIIREIEFEPNIKQAGIGILNYFGEVFHQKHPDTPIKLRVEQEGDIVRLVIGVPEGDKELVKEALRKYGDVVEGQTPPEEFLDDKLQVMELKQKLEMSLMEVRHKQDLLGIQKERVDSLESKVDQLLLTAAQGMKGESFSDILNALADFQRVIKGSDLTADQQREVSEAVSTLKDQSQKKHNPDKDVIAEATEKVDQVSKLAVKVAAAWAKVKPLIGMLFPG